MIDVVRDLDGLRKVFPLLLQEDFDRSRIQRSMQGARPEQLKAQLDAVATSTYSPGYTSWCRHLMRLEGQHSIGVAYGSLTSFEVFGLEVLADERAVFNGNHPACGACGIRQSNRFLKECTECGAKFRQKGK